jgi:hypothetical protein
MWRCATVIVGLKSSDQELRQPAVDSTRIRRRLTAIPRNSTWDARTGRVPRVYARTAISPFRRAHLQALARLSDYEADVVERSFDWIDDSRYLIARAEILLHRQTYLSSFSSRT